MVHLTSPMGVGSVDCLLLSQTPRGQISKCFAKTITDRNDFTVNFLQKKPPQIYSEESGMALSYDYLFKILLIGDSGTGKTTVLDRFRKFHSGNTVLTIGRFSF